MTEEALPVQQNRFAIIISISQGTIFPNFLEMTHDYLEMMLFSNLKNKNHNSQSKIESNRYLYSGSADLISAMKGHTNLHTLSQV